MKNYIFSINVNVEFCLKNAISFEHYSLIYVIGKAYQRAEQMQYEGNRYYRLNMSKIHEQLPMMSDKDDTIYRHIKVLIDKGLVCKVPKLDYYNLTELGKMYDYNQSDQSEKNPTDVGKKSDDVPEKNPTYKENSNNSINKNITSYAGDETSKENLPIPKKVEEISNSPTLPSPARGNQEINEAIAAIKAACKANGMIYTGDSKETRYAKYLLSKKFAGEIAEFNMTLHEFIANIVKAGAVVKYAKPVTSAKQIYYNRGEVINKARQQKAREEEKKAKQEGQKKKVFILR